MEFFFSRAHPALNEVLGVAGTLMMVIGLLAWGDNPSRRKLLICLSVVAVGVACLLFAIRDSFIFRQFIVFWKAGGYWPVMTIVFGSVLMVWAWHLLQHPFSIGGKPLWFRLLVNPHVSQYSGVAAYVLGMFLLVKQLAPSFDAARVLQLCIITGAGPFTLYVFGRQIFPSHHPFRTITGGLSLILFVPWAIKAFGFIPY